jgi:hypothetical protein
VDRAPSLRGTPWAFVLQLRKKYRKTSVRVAGECQLAKNNQSGLAIQLNILKWGTTKLVFRRKRQGDKSNALHVYSGGAQFKC